MAVAITMPQMGESVVEGTVARWLKAPGDTVDKLEPLLEINTDKIDTEVPAPIQGALLQILVEAGETVAAGTVLGYLGDPGEIPPAEDGSDAQPLQEATAPAAEQTSTAPAASRPDSAAVSARGRTARSSQERPQGRDFISPVVARVAAEHAVDLTQIAGTGMGGRITKKDVMAHIAQREHVQPRLAPKEVGLAPPTDAATADAGEMGAGADETFEPLTAMRQAIARHMVQSKHTSPHVTTVFEADMTAVVRHREAHKDELARRGIRLTYTPYFVAAVAQALRAVPAMNARFEAGQEPQGIAYATRVHIGIAVALADGLIVPVIRDADELTLAGLARSVGELSEQAHAGTLPADATRGGTFTITNHGVSGSLVGTPVINQPQAGILGVGAIVKRPVVRSESRSLLPHADDAIVIRPMCYLSLSFDHRVLDGAQADNFLGHVVRQLEQWPENAAL